MNLLIVENEKKTTNLGLTTISNIIDTEKEKVYRKAVLSDFINDTSIPVLDNFSSIKFEKSKRYRIQGEFGEKKYIKP